MRLTIITAMLLGVAAVPGAANAQVPTPAAQADALVKLKAADTNKDGKWDKPEWLAAGRREIGFNFIDADKDGFVTQPELKAGMERMKAMQSSN